jgi:Cu(I)/Ag(I) efflux system membrane protein CusA/SilA
MTVTVMSMVLVPIVWASGTGSDVMQRIAAPMIGGIFTAFLMEFSIYPVVFELGKTRELRA